MADQERTLTDTDLAQDKMGRNSLQCNDQVDVQNQRHAVAGVKQEAEDVIESFRRIDKNTRAEKESGKSD